MTSIERLQKVLDVLNTKQTIHWSQVEYMKKILEPVMKDLEMLEIVKCYDMGQCSELYPNRTKLSERRLKVSKLKTWLKGENKKYDK